MIELNVATVKLLVMLVRFEVAGFNTYSIILLEEDVALAVLIIKHEQAEEILEVPPAHISIRGIPEFEQDQDS